jgi:hypothetical protein
MVKRGDRWGVDNDDDGDDNDKKGGNSGVISRVDGVVPRIARSYLASKRTLTSYDWKSQPSPNEIK